MSIDAEFLLSRLPAFYRERDEREGGGALRALLAVLAEQGALLEADIARLYDSWFIETCDEALVPYIGDLLGVRGLYGVAGTAAFSPRALVANTLRMRRRKGTLPALEQVAFDSTGWPAHAVEFFERLQATQHLNHLRPHSLRTPDLRHTTALERLGGPFGSAAHTADVRALPDGRYNIPNVGLWLWRLQAYPLARVAARPHPSTAGLYFIDVLGRDLPLFNLPQPEAGITQLAGPLNLPEPLSRRVLHDELGALRQALADGEDRPAGRLPPDGHGASIRLWVDGAEVPPEHLVACHLGALPGVAPPDWRRPPATLSVPARRPGRPALDLPAGPGALLVGIDPVLGRLALPAGRSASRVEVSSAYGFPGDVGAGPYDRRPLRRADEAAEGLPDPAHFAQVLQVPGDFATLALALAAVAPGRSTLVRWDSDSAETVAPTLDLKNTHLAIQAVNRRRPALIGDLGFRGNAASRLSLSGLLLAGALRLQGPLQAVELRHCSLLPSAGGIVHSGAAPGLSLRLRRSLCGPVWAAGPIAGLDAADCLFDGAAGAAALRLPGSALALQRCTVFGSTEAGQLEAGNCLFTGRVSTERQQQGCVRFCYLPRGSETPRRYRCQPDLVMQQLRPEAARAEAIRVTPSFTSLEFGQPGYGQLLSSTAPEVRAGAEDGAEMGVWNLLRQPQREANLRVALDEYLRFGLAAAALYVN